jgi:hypothetical protein
LIGLQPAVGEGALSFAQRAALTLPEQAALILEIAALYNQLTFGQQEKPELVLEYLKDRIQTFKSSKP